MNRIKGIIAAGTLTGLILITAIVLGLGNGTANGESAALPATSNTVQVEPAGDLSGAEAVQAWQDYSRELENTVAILQQREAAYQTQLEAANSTIIQLEQQVNSANQAPSLQGHAEHEQAEHEGFFDD